MAPNLVGTPNDIRDLIGYRTGRVASQTPPLLARGWRAGIVGQLFDDLLAGRKSVRVADATSDSPLVFEPVEPRPEPPRPAEAE